ncbi:MAG TPA: response regulator [Chloroflexota bacterium]|nr:response regulator [Chloroflexota bacterium]
MPASQRVLVVEDNDLNYSLVEFVLGQQGLLISRADTGQQALDMATADPPDLVFMDIQLPGMDGLEVTRRLRQNPLTQGVPIVALTALAMAGDEERVLAAGCDAYLSKPVSPVDLVAVASRFLDIRA